MSIVGQTAHIDIGVTESLARWLAFGIDPGSFGMALLKGDRAAAYEAAHPVLHEVENQREGNQPAEDIVATMFQVTESAIPSFARGEYIERWQQHKGLSKAPESIKTMLKLSIENAVIYNYIAKNYPDVLATADAKKPQPA